MRHLAAMGFVGFGTFACIFAASRAFADITVNSNVESVDGVRVQATITNPTSTGPEGGGGQTAVGIKQVTATVRIRDDNIFNGIAIQKHQLTAFQAYGAGHPLGHDTPPITDPQGPWFGLVWPYRDQYDYFPMPEQPLGDDVGTFFQDQPGLYGFANIAGIARGGPTDPAGGDSPNLLLRGITGNGLTGPATYFYFDITPLTGPANRFVQITIDNASAVVVQRDDLSGVYSEVTVPIPSFQILYQLPEPSVALLGFSAALLFARRRIA